MPSEADGNPFGYSESYVRPQKPPADPLSQGRDKQFGLVSKEYEAVLGRMLGNQQQALAHIGNLGSATQRARGAPVGM